MDKIRIINFNKQIKIYKYWGWLYDNIDNEIVDGSTFVSMESGSYNWCLFFKVQG